MTKLTQNYFISHNNLLNVKFNPIHVATKKRTRWIVATINPIPCRPYVHHGTFPKVLIDKFYSSKHREIIIFAHNLYFKQTQTKQLIVLIYNQVLFSFD